jgi:hypothetical protein
LIDFLEQVVLALVSYESVWLPGLFIPQIRVYLLIKCGLSGPTVALLLPLFVELVAMPFSCLGSIKFVDVALDSVLCLICWSFSFKIHISVSLALRKSSIYIILCCKRHLTSNISSRHPLSTWLRDYTVADNWLIVMFLRLIV